MSETAEPAIHVGLSSGIIQDGNYGDFTVGGQSRFALEFDALDELRPASTLEALGVVDSIRAETIRIRPVSPVGDGAWTSTSTDSSPCAYHGIWTVTVTFRLRQRIPSS